MRATLAAICAFATGLTAGCSGGPRTPSDLPEPLRARCAAMRLEDIGPTRSTAQIFGVDRALRRDLADRLARGRVPVVSARVDGCNVVVNVLRCTRPIAWEPTPWYMAPTPPEPWVAFSEPDWTKPTLFAESLGKQRILGAGHLLAVAEGPVILQTAVTAHRPASSFAELVASGFRHPLVDPRRQPLPDPPFDVSELSGPDCADATHVVDELEIGAYRAFAVANHRLIDATDCQPPGCAEPMGLHASPVTRRGCPGATSRTPAGCTWLRRPIRFGATVAIAPGLTRDGRLELDAPGPGARPEACHPWGGRKGPWTPRGAAALARFERGEYAAAALELESIAAGETGDDPGNVETAQWRFAEASFRAGDVAGALSAFEVIAQTRCHPYAGAAAVWLAIEARRAQVPPSEW